MALFLTLIMLAFFIETGTSRDCRCLPDSPCWPDAQAWAEFNTSLGGRLFEPRPYAFPCHDPHFNEAECNTARRLQNNAFYRATVPGAMQYTDWEEDLKTGRNCPIGNSTIGNITRLSPCFQGSVPSYAINVSNIFHIQKGVQFAASHNLRLVIKSTGHDWKGRSTAPGSLEIWLHNLKEVVIHEEFVPQGCSSSGPSIPAVTAQSGVQMRQLYDRVGEANRVVVGGMGASVSCAGGYVPAGGHGPLTRTYGLAADNVVEFTVVTADGQVRVANRCQNKDLFYALSGGGAGTYGVVYSASFRTFPGLNPVVWILYVVGSSNPVSHRNLVHKFIQLGPQMDRDRLAGYFYIYTNYMVISFLLPNGSVSSAEDALGPLVEYVNQDPGLVTINKTFTAYENFVDYHKGVLCTANPDSCTDQTGFVRRLATRFIPKDLIEDSPELLTQTFMEILGRGFSPVVGLFVVGGEASNVVRNNSVAGFWRRALWHISLSVTWSETTSLEEQHARQRYLTYTNELLRNITPGSGCYMNEADYNEPDWQQSFYGENYPILKSIKNKVDPTGLFVCHHCVGSEDWDKDLNCPVEGTACGPSESASS